MSRPSVSIVNRRKSTTGRRPLWEVRGQRDLSGFGYSDAMGDRGGYEMNLSPHFATDARVPLGISARDRLGRRHLRQEHDFVTLTNITERLGR
jgi:hypothetical protein